ncbi:MAG: hypothetical protein NTY04_04255, partial [Candidatus Staskawiczbacteria bacterium]|nr:hypothetical protein [Candidatus Staskawiczbacteria bacterium]
SFTNDAIGNAFNFRIAGAKSASQNVQFDNSGVAISGKPLSKTGVSMASTAYSFTAYPPRMTVQDVAIISAKINNSTDKDQTVDINWSLYKWDGIDPANLIRTEKAKSTIKSNSSNTVQFNVPENTEPVYYVTGVLTYKDSKSIIDVRFIRPEIDKIKLNFPSITSFPIKNSADSTMFSCLYNSGTSSSVQGGKLVLKITDSIGNTVSQYTYQGAVTGNMMAVKKDFKSKNNLDHFFLSAQLFQSDKLVDQSTTEYDCKKIDPKLCNVSNGLGIFEIIAIIILIVALIYGATIVFSKNKKIKVKR